MGFEFVEFSKKQLQLLNWWQDFSPIKGFDTVLADGAIRSGKTIAMICSFLQWSQIAHEHRNLILASKSIGALKRNVISPMMQILEEWGWPYNYNRSDNYIQIGSNTYHMFGAATEASQDILQGLTAAGCLLDEAALFPESFINQVIGRCSVAGARLFLNCNPAGSPSHWFYKEFIAKAAEKNIYYMHFLMKDNLSLPQSTIERYDRMFRGVWHDRNVKGAWVVAEGLIYPAFANNPIDFVMTKRTNPDSPKPSKAQMTKKLMKINIGIDWGDNKAYHSFVATGITYNYNELVALSSERHAATDLTPADIERLVVKFVRRIVKTWGKVDFIYCDHINTLINGCRAALKAEGLHIPIGKAYKAPIIERIFTLVKLMGMGRFYIDEEECTTLHEALSTAVWNPDEENERLDDGTSDVDTLDAHEYGWSGFLDLFSII